MWNNEEMSQQDATLTRVSLTLTLTFDLEFSRSNCISGMGGPIVMEWKGHESIAFPDVKHNPYVTPRRRILLPTGWLKMSAFPSTRLVHFIHYHIFSRANEYVVLYIPPLINNVCILLYTPFNLKAKNITFINFCFEYIFAVKLTIELFNLRGQQHSFPTCERVFLWKCSIFRDTNIFNWGGRKTPAYGFIPNVICCPMFLNTGSGGIDTFVVELTSELLSVRGKQHLFSTHEWMFFSVQGKRQINVLQNLIKILKSVMQNHILTTFLWLAAVQYSCCKHHCRILYSWKILWLHLKKSYNIQSISNHLQTQEQDGITYPCHNTNGGLVTPPFTFGHECNYIPHR